MAVIFMFTDKRVAFPEKNAFGRKAACAALRLERLACSAAYPVRTSGRRASAAEIKRSIGTVMDGDSLRREISAIASLVIGEMPIAEIKARYVFWAAPSA